MYTAPGYQSASLHLMIGKEGRGGGAQLDFPGRMHPAHRLPQQWMHRVVMQVLCRFLSFVPVALGLPRVQRKLEKSRRLSRVERVPRDRMAVAVQRANAIHERTTVVLVAPLGRQDDGVGLMRLRLFRKVMRREQDAGPARQSGYIRHRASGGPQARKELWRGCFATNTRRRRHIRPTVRR